MNGKIDAFYGAEVVDDNGQAIWTLPHKTVVEVVEPFGKPANRLGEWTKVSADGKTGWVQSSQVHANYHGGSRAGAGRPTKEGEKMAKITVTLTPDLAAKADELGGGNVSAGVRIMAAKYELNSDRHILRSGAYTVESWQESLPVPGTVFTRLEMVYVLRRDGNDEPIAEAFDFGAAVQSMEAVASLDTWQWGKAHVPEAIDMEYAAEELAPLP